MLRSPDLPASGSAHELRLHADPDHRETGVDEQTAEVSQTQCTVAPRGR
jgi:hypothetical protein